MYVLGNAEASLRGVAVCVMTGYGSSVREAQTATVDSYGDSSDDGSSAQEASAAPPPSAPDGISTRENEHVEKLVMGVRDKNSAVDEPILDFLQKVTVEVMQSYSMDDMDNSLDFEVRVLPALRPIMPSQLLNLPCCLTRPSHYSYTSADDSFPNRCCDSSKRRAALRTSRGASRMPSAPFSSWPFARPSLPSR